MNLRSGLHPLISYGLGHIDLTSTRIATKVPSGEAKEKRQVKKVFDTEGAFGVAVVAPTASNRHPDHSGSSGESVAVDDDSDDSVDDMIQSAPLLSTMLTKQAMF
eukprot:1102569-Amphidinium_carterae.1